jgi:hypothetical protein
MLDDKLKAKLLIEHRPWENEPDFEEWIDEATGYCCRVKRNESTLSLCGYVAVPIGHKVRGMTYQQADEVGVHAHGGLTFGDKMDGHKWFGFDCAHADDLIPMFYIRQILSGYPTDIAQLTKGVYRTFDWVKKETAKLAKSIATTHAEIVHDEVMRAAKEALRSGGSVTEELAKRGYVHREKKRS